MLTQKYAPFSTCNRCKSMKHHNLKYSCKTDCTIINSFSNDFFSKCDQIICEKLHFLCSEEIFYVQSIHRNELETEA